MCPSDRKSALKVLIAFRELQAKNLKIGHSLIPLDILLTVYQHSADDPLHAINLKTLFNSLPYSDMGIRNHLNRLVDQHWLKVQADPDDKRSKKISLTRKSVERFQAIEAGLIALLRL